MKKLNLGICVSHACNMRHTFCFQNSFSNQRLSDSFLYDRLNSTYADSEYISVIGGELTVIPSMKEYLAHIRNTNREAKISIVTNGLAFDEDWIKVCIENRISVNFSLDATCEERYANLVATAENPFKEIYENYLNAVRAVENGLLLNCISMVVTDSSVDDIEDFVKLALRDGVNAQILYSNNECVPLTTKIKESVFKAMRLKEFCRNYIDVRLLNLPDEYCLNAYTNMQDFVASMKSTEKAEFLKQNPHRKAPVKYDEWSFYGVSSSCDRCTLPWNGLYIMPNGDVMICCCMSNYIIGNLYFQSIEEIRNSSYAKGIQEAIGQDDYSYCWERCRLNYYPKKSLIIGGFWDDLQKTFDSGKYEDYYARTEYENQYEGFADPKIIYQKAFSAHMIGKINEALELYNKALEKGFDEFWVRYNRADVYLHLGMRTEAKSDITIAHRLQPNHEGAREMAKGLEG